MDDHQFESFIGQTVRLDRGQQIVPGIRRMLSGHSTRGRIRIITLNEFTDRDTLSYTETSQHAIQSMGTPIHILLCEQRFGGSRREHIVHFRLGTFKQPRILIVEERWVAGLDPYDGFVLRLGRRRRQHDSSPVYPVGVCTAGPP